jgi:hypothetical protein
MSGNGMHSNGLRTSRSLQRVNAGSRRFSMVPQLKAVLTSSAQSAK